LRPASRLADRQVRPEASPAHRSADPRQLTSAPGWSEASTINTRASVRLGTAPCPRTNGTEKRSTNIILYS